MTLTAAQREAYARANTSIVEKHALELRHSTFPAPLRIIDHTEDISITLEANAPVDAGLLVVFTAMGLRMREPEINTEPDAQLQFQVDGVSGAVQPYIATANATSEPIEATLRMVTFNVVSKTVVEVVNPIHLQVRHIGETMTTASLTLGYKNSANMAFPNQLYTVESNPAL